MATPTTLPFATASASGIPTTPSTLITIYSLGATLVVVQNLGGVNKLGVEISFSADGVVWYVWPTTDFGGPDGTGIPPSSNSQSTLPSQRLPWIRVRAYAATGTTNVQVDLYQYAETPFGNK
jgi:hypothetical protein